MMTESQRIRFMYWFQVGLLTLSVCLVLCTSQEVIPHDSGNEENCQEQGEMCSITDLPHERPDGKPPRCWVTCLNEVNGQKRAGDNSYCHVTTGPAPGFYKCSAGRWSPTVITPAPLSREKRGWFRRRRRRSPPPNRPPYFTACPSGGITQYAPSRQTTVRVNWRVAAADPNGGSPSVRLVQGRGPNSVFNEGTTAIRYTASDGRLGATCAFSVRVIVRRCSNDRSLSSFPHGTQSCNGVQKRVYGSVCRHSCSAGYVLRGNQAVTCQSSSTWTSAFPSCQPRSCGDPGSVPGGQVHCPEGHVFPKSCAVQCNSGYQSTGATSTTCGSSGAWSPQLDPCRDVEAPKFPNGCPANQQLYSGPLESPIAVTWTDPVATDNSGETVTLTSDLQNGSLQGLGSHTVTITASDSANNTNSCHFVVTVTARECQPLLPPAKSHVTCTRNSVEGSECTVTCNLGYRLRGTATLTCLNTELWDNSLPTCEAIMCSPPTIQHGAFQCPSGFQCPAVCTFTCDPGFNILPPNNTECLENATWSSFGSCHDVEYPQFVHGCPNNVSIYASPLGSLTMVDWTEPDVTDNSGDDVNLQSNVKPGSSFDPGTSIVTYTATDVTGNNDSCQFSVNVTVLSCTDPNTSTDKKGQVISYNCSSGYVYGARCTVNCTQGYVLVGEDVIRCERDNNTHPPTMFWSWVGGPSREPVCRKNSCPPMPPPKNGALACHLGDKGQDCVMTCDASWDIPFNTEGHFYCLNAISTWMPGTKVPDCVVRMLPGRVRMQTNMFYVTGHCNTSLEELRQNFVTRLSTSRFKDACINIPSCAAENIEVTCGPVSSFRGKREAGTDNGREMMTRFRRALRSSRHGPPSHYVLVTFEIHIPYDEDRTAPELTYQNYMTSHSTLQRTLDFKSRAGQLNVGHLVADRFSVGPISLQADCPPGTALRTDHAFTRRFSCVGCSKGHYLKVNSTTCQECPVGFYTELDNATSCTPCPPGWSTPSTGSQHSSQCRVKNS